MISLFSLFFKSFKNILQILIKFDDSETHEILNKKVLLHSICDTRSHLYITIYTQRNELIKTTKRVLLSTFLVQYAKFLVEVRKRLCCV